MILKLRVPNYNEKHLVCEFQYKNKTCYADLTVLRDTFTECDVPVYIANDISDMVLYTTISRFNLNELGIF
jgi:hypothetical protein